MTKTTKMIVAGLLGLAVGLNLQSALARESESGGNHEDGHHGGHGQSGSTLSGPWMLLYKFPSATTNKAPVTKLTGVFTQTGTNVTFAAPGKEPVLTGTFANGGFAGAYYDTNNTAGHIEFSGVALNRQVVAGTAHQVENNLDGKFMAIRIHK